MGVSGGVWECGKPERFSIISMPQSEGEKGEATFSLRPRRGRSLAHPFPPSRPQAIPAAADFFLLLFLLEVSIWLWISRPLWSG